MSRPKSEPPRLPIVSFQWRTAEGIAMRLQPKNWVIFQHYKDRSPPWIKLHRDLLINRDFICLPLASKALAPLLWLLASESKDGTFDASFEELQFRLHISKKEYDDGIKPLIDKGFFYIASGMLADCNQVAIPEKETEIETETETKKKVAVAPVSIPDWMPTDTWYAFLQMRKRIKKPATEYAVQLLIAKLERFRQAGHDVQAILEKSITSGWQDVFEPKESVNKSFAQQATDIARTTVPGKQERDPALVKLDQDKLITKPPSLETLQKIAMLRTK